MLNNDVCSLHVCLVASFGFLRRHGKTALLGFNQTKGAIGNHQHAVGVFPAGLRTSSVEERRFVLQRRPSKSAGMNLSPELRCMGHAFQYCNHCVYLRFLLVDSTPLLNCHRHDRAVHPFTYRQLLYAFLKVMAATSYSARKYGLGC